MTKVSCSLEMCRCCGRMAESNELLQINRNEHVKRELMDCWKIQITAGDGSPQHICKPCYTKFDDYLNFRQECMKLQEQLKTLYKNMKSMMGRISIEKKSCAENSQKTDKGLAINMINFGNAEKSSNATQKQNQFPEKIVGKLVFKKINVDNASKNVIATQKQNQSFEEVNGLVVNKTNEDKQYILPQKNIKILGNNKIVVSNAKKNVSRMHKQNFEQKQYILPQEMFQELVKNKIVVGNAKKNVCTMQEQNQSFEQRQYILPPENIQELVSSKTAANAKKNVSTMQEQNQSRTSKISAKEAVEFIVFPDITYSKATISQTYMRNIIKQKTDNTNNDPLDATEINVIDSKCVQQTTMKNIIKQKTDNTNNDTLNATEINIINAESVQPIEENTEIILNVQETTTEFDNFFDEASQSTTISNTIDVEWETPVIKTIEKLSSRVAKELESLDETIPLKCKYCISDSEQPFLYNETFPTKAKLIEHILCLHHGKWPYQCQICKTRKFTSSQHCIYHIMHTHKQNKYVCQRCGIGPGHLKFFIEHIKRVHSFGDYECETCGKKFENVSLTKFEYHKRWHTRNRQLQCAYCAKTFVQSTHLQHHEMVHTKSYNINCETCGAGFRTQFNKAVHVYRVHGGDKPIKCIYCDKRFTIYTDRLKHMINVHDHVQKTFNEKIKCFKCKKLFRRETSYRRHLETDCLTNKNKLFQFKPKRFPCEQCSCRFRTERGLKQHVALHAKEGRPFECPICHLNYKSRSNLDTHHKIKHNPSKPYQCDICGKWFALRNILNGHRKFHKIK